MRSELDCRLNEQEIQSLYEIIMGDMEGVVNQMIYILNIQKFK